MSPVRLPLVSVVMSVFNGERDVAAAIDSIIEQSYPNWEFVIVDDGSTDRTSEILKRYAQSDSRFRIFQQENLGLTKSLNNAVRLSKGEFIARQDADDRSLVDRIENSIRTIGEKKLLVGGFQRVRDGQVVQNGFWKLMKRVPESFLVEALRRHNFSAHGTYFFEKAFFEKLGGYREYFRYTQDYDFLLRALDQNQVEFHFEPLSEIRINLGGISATKRKDQLAFAYLATILSRQRRSGQDESYSLLKTLPIQAALEKASKGHRAFLSSSRLSLKTLDGVRRIKSFLRLPRT